MRIYYIGVRVFSSFLLAPFFLQKSDAYLAPKKTTFSHVLVVHMEYRPQIVNSVYFKSWINGNLGPYRY